MYCLASLLYFIHICDSPRVESEIIPLLCFMDAHVSTMYVQHMNSTLKTIKFSDSAL